MKIVLTGASGFVGGQLVPALKARGAELFLMSRYPVELAKVFPEESTGGYDDVDRRARGFDLMVHLATLNNNSQADSAAFHSVNVEGTLLASREAASAGISRFVNFSSIHALNERNGSLYAISKREAARRLLAESDDALTIFLPAVHGQRFAGKLERLNRLPSPIRRLLLVALSSLRPTISINRLADYLVQHAASTPDREVVLSDGQMNNIVYRIIRRIMDLAAAGAIILLLWWLMLGIWIAVKVQSPGPGIYAQRRVGRDGAVFTCYKFRTMKLGTVEATTSQVSVSAVTPIGRFLRRTKIDELPQAWNLLRNEMTLVGPRPCLPVQEDLIEARRQRGVFAVKPGITGLAQVNGIDMSEPQRLARWDQRYIALQSLILDWKLLIATVLGKGQGDRTRT